MPDGIVRLSVGLNTDTALKDAQRLGKEVQSTLNKMDTGKLDSKTLTFIRNLTSAYYRMQKLSDEAQKLGNSKFPTQDYVFLSKQLAKSEQSLEKLIDRQSELERLGQTTTNAYANLQSNIQNTKAAIAETKNVMKEMEAANEAFISGKDTQAYKQKIQALNLQTQAVNILIEKFNELAQAEQRHRGISRGPRINGPGVTRGPSLDSVEGIKFLSQGEVVANIERVAVADEHMAEAENERAESTNTASEATHNANNATRAYGKTLGDVGKSILSSLRGAINKLVSAFKSLSRYLHSSNKSHGDFSRSMKHSLTTLLRYTLGVGGLLALIRKTRGYITESFKVLAQEVPEVNQAISMLGTSLKQLKAGFATMLQPLFQQLAPVFNAIIQKIIALMNNVSRFFATLTGQNYIYEATVANYDYAESVKAAEEANNGALASFDKLNVIAKDNTKNTLALTKDTVTYKKVEVNPDESWFTRLAKKIADGWKKADLSGATNDIAKKIAELLDSISWEDIRSKTTKFAHTLATGINGITLPDEKTGKSALAVSIGNTIAEALQTAIDTFDEFIKTINWSNLGKFIGDAIDALKQRLRDNDSWRNAGMAFGRLFQGLVELGLELFVKGNIFEGLGTDLADMLGAALEKGLEVNPETGNTYLKDFGIMLTDAITKFLDEVIAFLDKTSEDGKLAKAVNELFLGIDLLEIAKKLVVTFLKGFKLGLQLLISGGLGALGIEADEGTVKLLAEALGIGLLAKKIGGLVGGITGSNGLLSAFGKKDRALDTQRRKLGLEKIAVGLLTGVLGALGIQALTTSDELDVLTNEGVGSAVTAFEGLGDKVRDANKSLGEETEGAVERARLAFENLNLKLPEIDVSNLNVFEQYAYSVLQRIRAEYAKGIPEPKITKTSTIPSTPLYDLTQAGIKSTQTVMGQGVAQTEKDNTEATDANTTALDRQYEQQQAAIKATQQLTDSVVDLETYFGDNMQVLYQLYNDMNPTKSGSAITLDRGGGTTAYNTWKDAIVKEYNSLSAAEAKGVIEGLSNLLNNYYNPKTVSWDTVGLYKYLKSAGEGIQNLLKWLPTALGALFGIPVPGIARGAVLPPNKPFLAMVGDQKTGTNIEAPLSTIEQAVANVIGKMGIKVVFDVKGDPKGLFKVWQREAKVYSMQFPDGNIY